MTAPPPPTAPPPTTRPRWFHWAPLAVGLLLAAWPFGLWAVHRADPVAAVRLARGAATALTTTAFYGALLACGLLLLWPPAPAWLRLVATRTWRNLTLDRAPLERARSELQHFESAARQLEVGRQLRQLRQLAAAVHHLARAIELDPSVAGAHHQFGLALFTAGGIELAGRAFANAERLDPGHAFGDALLHLGRCQFLAGHPEAAASTLCSHQQRHGGSPKSHLWLAEVLDRIGDRDGARAALRTAAARPGQRLDAEQNWCRARARVRLWRYGAGR